MKVIVSNYVVAPSPPYSSLINTVAPKFESLIKKQPDFKKLEAIYKIPANERALILETTTSENSYSADHTPAMSASKSSASFSLKDLDSLLKVKKEQLEHPTVSKPPVSRPKASASKKRKAPETPAAPVVYLESFEDLAPSEVSNKILSMQTMINLGIEKLSFQAMDMEKKLAEANEKIQAQAETAKGKTLLYEHKLTEQRQALEAKMAAEAEIGQLSAARSVLECKIQMAEEAEAAGFQVPGWDVAGWRLVLESLGGDGDGEGKDGTEGGSSKVVPDSPVAPTRAFVIELGAGKKLEDVVKPVEEEKTVGDEDIATV